jgi:hypothetical protein
VRRAPPGRRGSTASARVATSDSSRFVFLAPRLRLSDGRRMPHPARDPQLLQHPEKPPHGFGGFDADHRRSWHRSAKTPVSPWCARVRSTTSPVSPSNIAIVCGAECKSHPIIRISASFVPSAVGLDRHTLLGPSRGRRCYDISFSVGKGSVSPVA